MNKQVVVAVALAIAGLGIVAPTFTHEPEVMIPKTVESILATSAASWAASPVSSCVNKPEEASNV